MNLLGHAYDGGVAPGRRLFLWALVASLSLTAAIAIGTLLFAEFDDTAGRILGTTALLAAASLLALPAGILLDQGRARPLAWGLVALAVAAFGCFMGLIWGDGDDTLGKTAGTLALFSGAASQTAALTARMRPEDPPRIERLYVLSLFLVAVLVGLATIALWDEVDDTGYYRALGAVAVASVLAALLQPILRRLEGPARGGVEVVFRLDREPSGKEVENARRALEEGGARVEEVVGPRV